MSHTINPSDNNIIHKDGWLPSYFHHQHEEYIFLTSLNLGGAEKIVSDQLWANYYSKAPTRYTLIVLYEKEKEHPLPPDVQVIRLYGKMESGNLLFQHIAFQKKNIVCHLINDNIAEHLFKFGIQIHLVIHNDIRGWSTSMELLEHPQIISLIAVCNYVKRQLEEYTSKPVFSVRHQIKFKSYEFNSEVRQKVRDYFNWASDEIVIGMIGRICEQKNYPLAIDAFYHLSLNYPDRKYRLIIAGGFEKKFTHIYLAMLSRINQYKLHDRVTLLGFRRDIHSLINGFDIALNTSYFEGLSMATQELMGNGLNVILSNVCGQSEIYDNHYQLDFFEMPKSCDTLNTIKYSYDNCSEEYLLLIKTISDKIYHLGHSPRHVFEPEKLKSLGYLCYGSHNLWSLFNHLKPIDKKIQKTAFLTSNLNLGGAQRSLTNLMSFIQENKEVLDCHDFNPPLILINQSNQTQFLTQLDNLKIPNYICQKSIDVFDIMKNMLEYIYSEGITQILFWNVESKIKLLLSKLLSHQIKLIDVSPGDYIFNEIKGEQDFSEAIYYKPNEYYSHIDKFVSKYRFESSNSFLDVLKLPPAVIPNGVYINEAYIKTDHTIKESFNFLVCGRIAPSKHLDIMFEALRNINNLRVKIFVIGNVEEYYLDYYQELQDDYQDLIRSGNIVFLGHHDNPQSIMKDYDAIIVLGTHQGSPNTVLEAAAVKLPIISNDSGGTKEVIDETTGILLPNIPKAEPLVKAMIDMMDNYSAYVIRAENCYRKIEEEFSMNKMAREYLSLIKPKNFSEGNI